MGTYRWFPSNPVLATASSPGTAFICGIAGEQRAASWLNAYWWYVPPGGSTSPQTFIAWCLTGGPGAGTAIAGTAVTATQVLSGTLIAGQWNRIPLPVPVPLAPATTYVFQTGFTIPGAFANANHYFDVGGIAPAGVTVNNGLGQAAIVAYGDSTAGGSNGNPWGSAQGVFLTGSGADPTAHLAISGSLSSNYGMDAEFTDVTPAAYTGTFEGWPNSFAANASTVLDLNVNYNVGSVFQLLARCPVLGVKYFVPAGASGLATAISLWSVSGLGRVKLAGNASPSWTATGGGWQYATFAQPVILPAGTYVAAVYNANGTLVGGWNAKDSVTSAFGAAGPLSAGITMGPLFIPPQASSALCYDYNGALPGAVPPYNAGTTENGQAVFGQDPGGAEAAPFLYAGAPSGSNPQNYFVSPVAGQPVAGGWSLPLMELAL